MPGTSYRWLRGHSWPAAPRTLRNRPSPHCSPIRARQRPRLEPSTRTPSETTSADHVIVVTPQRVIPASPVQKPAAIPAVDRHLRRVDPAASSSCPGRHRHHCLSRCPNRLQPSRRARLELRPVPRRRRPARPPERGAWFGLRSFEQVSCSPHGPRSDGFECRARRSPFLGQRPLRSPSAARTTSCSLRRSRCSR